MLRTTALLLIALAAALVVAAGGSAKERYDLKGEVYANSMFKIELRTAGGKRVTTLKAGTYVIKVEDRASTHNFHLRGPGVNKWTTVRGTGERLWTVKLRAGRYTFVCDPHASAMRGAFRVTG
jgi:plastocyanin